MKMNMNHDAKHLYEFLCYNSRFIELVKRYRAAAKIPTNGFSETSEEKKWRENFETLNYTPNNPLLQIPAFLKEVHIQFPEVPDGFRAVLTDFLMYSEYRGDISQVNMTRCNIGIHSMGNDAIEPSICITVGVNAKINDIKLYINKNSDLIKKCQKLLSAESVSKKTVKHRASQKRKAHHLIELLGKFTTDELRQLFSDQVDFAGWRSKSRMIAEIINQIASPAIKDRLSSDGVRKILQRKQ